MISFSRIYLLGGLTVLLLLTIVDGAGQKRQSSKRISSKKTTRNNDAGDGDVPRSSGAIKRLPTTQGVAQAARPSVLAADGSQQSPNSKNGNNNGARSRSQRRRHAGSVKGSRRTTGGGRCASSGGRGGGTLGEGAGNLPKSGRHRGSTRPNQRQRSRRRGQDGFNKEKRARSRRNRREARRKNAEASALTTKLIETGEMFPVKKYPSDVNWTNRFADYTPFKDYFMPHEDSPTIRIYFMTHEPTKRRCVIKVVELNDEDRLVQLVEEIVLLSEITPTQNLIKFYHAFVDDVPDEKNRPQKALCMVMEYLNGGDLYDAFYHDRYIDEESLRPLVRDAIIGLEALHAHGLMHHDIKLDNIMLHRDENDERERAVIIDVGICERIRKDGGLVDGHTGTLRYIPPETLIYDGQNEVGDMYALGIVVHRMLIGNTPVSKDDVRDIINARNRESVKTTLEYVLEDLHELNDMNKTPLTPSCRSFIRDLLTIDWRERRRLTENILNHPWLDDDIFEREWAKLCNEHH